MTRFRVWPLPAIVFVIISVMVLLTELTTNTAAALLADLAAVAVREV